LFHNKKEKNMTEIIEENGYFLVDYAEPDEGLFLRTGYFSTREAAESRAGELEGAEEITREMLAGDVE